MMSLNLILWQIRLSVKSAVKSVIKSTVISVIKSANRIQSEIHAMFLVS